MTLLVALKGTDGIALAADSRGTFGDPRGVTAQNDSQQKAHILSQHAAVLVAGSGELGQHVITQTLDQIRNGNIDGVTDAMTALRDTVRTRFSEWFPTLPPVSGPAQQAGQAAGRPEAIFVVAGYDRNPSSGAFDQPKIYQLLGGLDFPPMLHQYGFAVAGVAQYALYLLNRLYEPNRSVQELVPLAAYTITETASQDGKVGGPVRVITVTPKGCLALTEAEVAGIVAQNERRAENLRDSFYERGNLGG